MTPPPINKEAIASSSDDEGDSSSWDDGSSAPSSSPKNSSAPTTTGYNPNLDRTTQKVMTTSDDDEGAVSQNEISSSGGSGYGCVTSNDDDEEEEDMAQESDVEPPDPPGIINASNTRVEKAKKKGKAPVQKGKGPHRRRSNNKRQSKQDEDLLDVEPIEMSIHKINLRHAKFATLLKDEKRIIEEIIRLYNYPTDRKDKKRKGALFCEEDFTKQPRMLTEDKALFEQDIKDFEVMIYLQKIDNGMQFLTSGYGVKEKDVKARLVHCIIFYYRKKEIYALTTGQAWNVVQWCSDFAFPGDIAARILSEKGMNESNTKGLVGNIFSAKNTHKQLQESNPYDLLVYVTSYTSEIRDDASILALQCFQDDKYNAKKMKLDDSMEVDGDGSDSDRERDRCLSYLRRRKQKCNVTPPPQSIVKSTKRVVQGVKVLVSQGSIRIKRRFCPCDFAAVLNHLTLISDGRKTRTIHGVEEKDTSAFKQYLSPVSLEMAKNLDLELASRIHDGVATDNGLDKLENFDFCHKHFTQWYYGTEFFLKYQNERNNIKVWKDRPPSCKVLIKTLRRIGSLTSFKEGATEENFLKELKKVKILYRINNGREGKGKDVIKGPEKLLNFIEGNIQSKLDNQVYWHIQAKWCYVHPAYLFLANEQFTEILNKNLVPAEKVELTFKWQTSINDEDETQTDALSLMVEYLERYKQGDDKVFISPNPEEDIVDMLRLNGNNKNGEASLTIYYIIPGFKYKTFCRGLHITQAVLQMQKSKIATSKSARKTVGGAEINLERLQKLYESVMKEELQPYCKAFPDFTTFQRSICNATVVVGVGQWGRDVGDSPRRSLYEESNLPVKLSPQLILKELQKSKNLGIKEKMKSRFNDPAASDEVFAKELYSILQRHEHLAQDGSLTSKLFVQTANRFWIEELGALSEPFFAQILSCFQPNSVPLMSKLELIRMSQMVHNNGVKEFKIVEIQAEDELTSSSSTNSSDDQD